MAVFYWSLRDCKSPEVSMTLLSILANLNSASIWIVSICPLIPNSSSHLSKTLGTVPNTPIITGITVTLIFHNFLSSLAKSKYLSLFSLSLILTLWSAGTAKSIIWLVGEEYLSLSVVIWPGSRDLLVSQNPGEFCVPYSLGQMLVYYYYNYYHLLETI